MDLNQAKDLCERARTHAVVDDYVGVIQNLESIPPQVRGRPEIATTWNSLYAWAMKQHGLRIFKDFVNYLLWNAQPSLALRVLEECVPASIEEQAELRLMQRELKGRLPHLEGWEEYKKAYDELPPEIFHTPAEMREGVMAAGRARALLRWVKEQPLEGPPIGYCSIGCQDAIMETAALEANPRLVLTVCDVSENASKAVRELVQRFTQRVSIHRIQRHLTDWPVHPGVGDSNSKFDLVSIFEVIEHVPETVHVLAALNHMLRDGGTLLLSTPVADRWVESILTQKAPDFYAHVRAFSPLRLWYLLRQSGFSGTLNATDGTSIFLAEVKKTGHPLHYGVEKLSQEGVPPNPGDLYWRRLAIVAPQVDSSNQTLATCAANFARSLEFDDVTVYTQLKPTPDGSILHGDGITFWRDSNEFDPQAKNGRVVYFQGGSS